MLEGRAVGISHEKSIALQRRAQQLLPLGVNSNFRYWGEGITPYVQKAKGGYLWDVDGNRYIDYRLAFGPIILGHADPDVNARVHTEIDQGSLFAMTSELEVAVAEKIVAMCPAMERVRFATSGTEATMHALRIARAYTGREKILKFEGNYHGFQDYMLFSTYAPSEVYGSRHSPVPIPSSSGLPACLHSLVVTLPFNDFEGLERTLRRVGHELAAIITEPVQDNCGAIEPLPGFLEFIRQKCDEYGIVFILDEVKTGFRIARGGAQEVYNLKPDLATYAKSLANGYPLAAVAGKRDIMDVVGRGVAQGGTFNNNKPGVAAAFATLEKLQSEPILETIARRGRRLMDGLQGIFEAAGLQASFRGHPAMFSYAFGVEQVTCQREWDASDRDYYLRLVDAAIERGVMPDHDPREPWYLCYAHSEADIDETLNVMADAVRVARR
ncbi:MAG: aspartate aminotransferase family protein [Chloroflexi bacterium]|nr:aspartate aminotransferase family protein [Chloroflexota bacterium]